MVLRILYKCVQNISSSIPKTTNNARSFFVHCYDRERLKRAMSFVFSVPLGSVPELPAESCTEIRASEGENAVSGNYWFDFIKPGEVVLARCDMSKLGKSTLGVLPQFSACTFSNKPLL